MRLSTQAFLLTSQSSSFSFLYSSLESKLRRLTQNQKNYYHNCIGYYSTSIAWVAICHSFALLLGFVLPKKTRARENKTRPCPIWCTAENVLNDVMMKKCVVSGRATDNEDTHLFLYCSDIHCFFYLFSYSFFYIVWIFICFKQCDDEAMCGGEWLWDQYWRYSFAPIYIHGGSQA